MTKLNTPLTIDEIDFRIQSINKGGYATIVPYKDARVDMNRLDAVYGVDGWQKKYELINGNLFCSIGIYSEKLSQWIWKQDVGTESNNEKEKGQASDAFKRACFNLGIGRELYDYPQIQIKLKPNEFENKEGKIYATYQLNLRKWRWESTFENGKLISLMAFDTTQELRYAYSLKSQMQAQSPVQQEVEKPKQNNTSTLPLATDKQVEQLLIKIKSGTCTDYSSYERVLQFTKEQKEKLNNALKAESQTPNT